MILFERKYSLFSYGMKTNGGTRKMRCTVIEFVSLFGLNSSLTIYTYTNESITPIYIRLYVCVFYFPFAFYLYRSFQLSIKKKIYFIRSSMEKHCVMCLLCVSSSCMHSNTHKTQKHFGPSSCTLVLISVLWLQDKPLEV